MASLKLRLRGALSFTPEVADFATIFSRAPLPSALTWPWPGGRDAAADRLQFAVLTGN